jgi:hypothetical protein
MAREGVNKYWEGVYNGGVKLFFILKSCHYIIKLILIPFTSLVAEFTIAINIVFTDMQKLAFVTIFTICFVVEFTSTRARTAGGMFDFLLVQNLSKQSC